MRPLYEPIIPDHEIGAETADPWPRDRLPTRPCTHAARARASLRGQTIMGQGRGMQACGEGLAGTHQWGIKHGVD